MCVCVYTFALNLVLRCPVSYLPFFTFHHLSQASEPFVFVLHLQYSINKIIVVCAFLILRRRFFYSLESLFGMIPIAEDFNFPFFLFPIC